MTPGPVRGTPAAPGRPLRLAVEASGEVNRERAGGSP